VEAGELLTTNYDNVSSMAIVVFENTSPDRSVKSPAVSMEGMKRLAGTSLRGIPQGPRGKEKVKVIFHVGQDNMLKVTARSMSNKFFALSTRLQMLAYTVIYCQVSYIIRLFLSITLL
jgi:molecular chaperone DnaK (HSP70)